MSDNWEAFFVGCANAFVAAGEFDYGTGFRTDRDRDMLDRLIDDRCMKVGIRLSIIKVTKRFFRGSRSAQHILENPGVYVAGGRGHKAGGIIRNGRYSSIDELWAMRQGQVAEGILSSGAPTFNGLGLEGDKILKSLEDHSREIRRITNSSGDPLMQRLEQRNPRDGV